MEKIDGAVTAELSTFINIDGDDGRMYVENEDGADTIKKYDREGNVTGEIKGDKYSTLNVYITGVKIKEYEDGNTKYKKFFLFMKTINKGDKLTLSLSYPNALAFKIIELLPNVDLHYPVAISTYKKGDYKQIAFKQNGDVVKSKYVEFTEKDGKWTAKQINGYPKKKVNMSDEDYEQYKLDVKKFLTGVLENEIMPRFAGLTTTEQGVQAMVQNDKVDSDKVDDNDIQF